MSIEIRVPTLPESVADATLISWHKAVGDFIQKDENLVDLETDKVVLEVPAPESGILTEIISQDGSTVTSGDLLAIFTVQASPSTNSTEKSPPTQQEPTHVNAEIPLSPAVRRIIFENNLDPSLIKGTGKGGRITKADVQDYLANNTQESTPSVTVDMPKAVITQPAVSTKEEGRAVSNNSPRPEQRVPMTRLRAKVAERLLQAQQNAAMLTTFNEVNMQNVIDLRNNIRIDLLQNTMLN